VIDPNHFRAKAAERKFRRACRLYDKPDPGELDGFGEMIRKAQTLDRDFYDKVLSEVYSPEEVQRALLANHDQLRALFERGRVYTPDRPPPRAP
jgi:hypothetical protein